MAVTIAITNERYEEIKKNVLDQKTIQRINVSLAEIEIESLKVIKIKDILFLKRNL